MTTALEKRTNGPLAPTQDFTPAELALVNGDLSKLTTEQRSVYYRQVCDSLSLNHLTQPFQYITLNGKLVLYARRDCTDQLRRNHKVSVNIVSRETIMEGLFVVTAKATTHDGRTDESIGAVNIGGLKGDALANALMKAETKAKRRVTLSVCGLGWLDETEIDTVPHAQHPPAQHPQQIEHDNAPEPEAVPTITAAQWKELQALADKTPAPKLSLQTLLAHVKASRGSQIPASRFQEAVTMLRNMAEPVPEGEPGEIVPPASDRQLTELADLARNREMDDSDLETLIRDVLGIEEGNPHKLNSHEAEQVIEALKQ